MSENLPGSHATINHPPTENVAAEPRQADPMHGKPSEVFQTFLKIGLTAFGGPIAHLGYFEREIIERRNWLPQNAYGDLVALCQFLPGPASSQVAFALGYLRAGIGGAFAAIAGFTVPSAVLMDVLQLCSRAEGRGRRSAIQFVAANSPRMRRCSRPTSAPAPLQNAWPLRIIWIAS